MRENHAGFGAGLRVVRGSWLRGTKQAVNVIIARFGCGVFLTDIIIVASFGSHHGSGSGGEERRGDH